MAFEVLCLRPEADFARVDALPPPSLQVTYGKPDDPTLSQRIKAAAAVVIPAVGPKLAGALFEGCSLRLVQITGAGVDRLDEAAMTRLGIPVANVPGASNSAVAEYAVTAASMLLRRLAWANTEISQGHYGDFRSRMLADNLPGLEGLLVGVVGFGTIGTAVAHAFQRMGCRIG
ncbi:MAG TPA: NAD(P)-dependent oxidoreductase, partial [Xanthobacteraceae bacterium]|nr:NAD(P)-dependent oxidoreductase [Xanthobacteraceae bacterium]